MKELFKNKFLVGVLVVFWLSLYCVLTLQVRVEAKSQESFNAEISLNTK